MYTQIRAENRSINYRIDLASMQFFTASNQNCLGGSLVIAKELGPNQTQSGTVPNKPCVLSYTIVTFKWTHLPSGKGGIAQGPRVPDKGTPGYTHYWTEPSNLDAEVFGDGAIPAPILNGESAQGD